MARKEGREGLKREYRARHKGQRRARAIEDQPSPEIDGTDGLRGVASIWELTSGAVWLDVEGDCVKVRRRRRGKKETRTAIKDSQAHVQRRSFRSTEILPSIQQVGRIQKCIRRSKCRVSNALIHLDLWKDVSVRRMAIKIRAFKCRDPAGSKPPPRLRDGCARRRESGVKVDQFDRKRCSRPETSNVAAFENVEDPPRSPGHIQFAKRQAAGMSFDSCSTTIAADSTKIVMGGARISAISSTEGSTLTIIPLAHRGQRNFGCRHG
ncbi:hypothetical protein C8R44DRAFT_741093 [Mycena epipterygia]|nr:hypothetical protein C8R44DRAFT_741093 [Mycena epipterygia]